MVRLAQERVLLIGDADREVSSALSQALPDAQVKSVATVFDAIAELSQEKYTTIIAPAEPIERRPEAAVRTLRDLAGDGRLLLFGHPTLEPVSRKMMQFGCDDYLVTPATAGELEQIISSPPMRLRSGGAPDLHAPLAAPAAPASAAESLLAKLPLAELVLDAMLQHPADAVGGALRQLRLRLPPATELHYLPESAPVPAAAEGSLTLSRSVRGPGTAHHAIHLIQPKDQDAPVAMHFLSELAALLEKLLALQERHNGLQRLAITDDLTGIYNGRYFRHFLARIIEKARAMRFPVTLFFFDIDDFKKYNDQYGHGVGDEILRETAALMRRCCRDHDLVARIGGDEFVAVFWEKDGPRVPRDPRNVNAGRAPQEPRQILDRFRRLLLTQTFHGLGPTGKGELTISGGLAVYPFDAQDVQGLIDAADKALMFGAKRAGRNSIHLVGGAEAVTPDAETSESAPDA